MLWVWPKKKKKKRLMLVLHKQEVVLGLSEALCGCLGFYKGQFWPFAPWDPLSWIPHCTWFKAVPLLCLGQAFMSDIPLLLLR